MTRHEFAAVERRIRENHDEDFLTLSGLPLRYEVDGDRIKFSRVRTRTATMNDARRVWEMGPSTRLTEVDQAIPCRAYLFAILRDPRIAT